MHSAKKRRILMFLSLNYFYCVLLPTDKDDESGCMSGKRLTCKKFRSCFLEQLVLSSVTTVFSTGEGDTYQCHTAKHLPIVCFFFFAIIHRVLQNATFL